MGYVNESVIFYRSFYAAIESIEDPVEKAKAYKAVINYGLNGVSPKEGGSIGIIYTMAKPQIDANVMRRENGKKGGRPPKESNGIKDTGPEDKNKDTTGNKSKEPVAKGAETTGYKDKKPLVANKKNSGLTNYNHINEKHEPNEKVNANVNETENVNDKDNVNDNDNVSSSSSVDGEDGKYIQIMDLYNSIIGERKITSITPLRKSNIDEILSLHSIDDFKKAFTNAKNSTFLNERRLTTFDWLVNLDNFVKVLSDNYKDTPEQAHKKETSIKFKEIEDLYLNGGL